MLYLKKCVVFQFLEFESDSDHMESIYYPALTLEEDVILEIQINGPPGPEHKKTEEGRSPHKICYNKCSGFFCSTNQLRVHVSA